MRIGNRRKIKKAVLALSVGLGMSWAGATWAQPEDPAKGGQDLTDLSLEKLTDLNVIVTSSSKKAESLRNASSAIYVITAEDIRRSGFQHVAELFRMVPGMQVARQNAGQWAISARGFDAVFNNKMLVLVDGRSVYETTLGGVDWNALDMLLEDIDHIEVIRGPGGALWGSNAVNGVVNIITKDSKVTQGLYATALEGSPIRQLGALRYGARIGSDLYYRFYVKSNEHEALIDQANQAGAGDGWRDRRGGFRVDWHGEKDTITVQGDYQEGFFDSSFRPFDPTTLQPAPAKTNWNQGFNVLANWDRNFSAESEIRLLAYYDLVDNRTNDGNLLRGTAKVEFQHRFLLDDPNEITWGVDFRNVSDRFSDPVDTFYFPGQEALNSYGAFLQDKITIEAGHWSMTAGIKYEQVGDTADAFQPSARLLWTPDPNNSLWAAVSKANRMPVRFENDAYLYYFGFPGFGGPYYGAVVPNDSLKPDEMVAYELGYRSSLDAGLSFDLATFYNRYYRIITTNTTNDTLPSPLGGQIVNEINSLNEDGGAIYGAEWSLKWEPTQAFQAACAYTYQDYDRTMLLASNIYTGAPPPHNLFNARASFRPADGLELNTAFYYTDATFLTNDPTTPSVVPDTCRWDLGATWRPDADLELSLWGQNLQGRYSETLVTAVSPAVDVVPSVYGQATVRY